MADHLRRLRRARERESPERRVRDRSNPLEIFTEEEVRQRYRLRPDSILFLCLYLRNELERTTARSNALPVLLMICASLRFLATGAFHQLISDTDLGISRSSVCRSVTEVLRALSGKVGDFIQFPRGAEARRVQRGFYQRHGFPSILGCVDGTQIKIQAPHENEFDYVCRKGFHSINVQLICDDQQNITNVVAQWPGSVHDSRILRESRIYQEFEQGEHEGLLLGDSGYALKPFLMTPYLNPATPAQERFNRSHIRSRVKVEQTIGVVKRRFAGLHYGLRMQPDKCCAAITSCCVLHNIAKQRNDIMPEGIPALEQGEEEAAGGARGVAFLEPAGQRARQRLTDTYFN